MAMNVGPGAGTEPEVMAEINTTPLIDVMLVLLIMLIVTIPIQLHSVTLDAPQPVSVPPPQPPVVTTVDVDADGSVRWNGEALAGREALEDRLRQAAVDPAAPEVHLKPDPRAAYRHVAAVLAAAQRLGVTRLGIVDGGDAAR
jgi:biopolymer transport protein ExbD